MKFQLPGVTSPLTDSIRTVTVKPTKCVDLATFDWLLLPTSTESTQKRPNINNQAKFQLKADGVLIKYTLTDQMEKLQNKLTNRPVGPAIINKRSTASETTHQGRQSWD